MSYSPPASAQVAPGQVITLFLHGIGPLPDGQLRSGTATALPLPAVLAGLSARVSQPQLSLSVPAPIFSVRQQKECSFAEALPACLLTSIRVQMPYELHSALIKSDVGGGTSASPDTEIVVQVDGQSSRSFPLKTVPDNAHVMTSCDLTWNSQAGSVCDRVAFHANGTVVNADAPATREETVLVYVFGLGQTTPNATTGIPSPAGTKLVDLGYRRLWATFRNDLLNANGATPRSFDPSVENDPGSPIAFAGLSPGQVGVYQLNIPIPQSFEPKLACGGDIHSNALLEISTVNGSEVLPLCVRP